MLSVSEVSDGLWDEGDYRLEHVRDQELSGLSVANSGTAIRNRPGLPPAARGVPRMVVAAPPPGGGMQLSVACGGCVISKGVEGTMNTGTDILRRARILAMLAAILCLAAALRLWGIDREPLWFDEAMTARFASMEPAEMMRATARDSSPPLYYLGLRAWTGPFGGDDAPLRAYSTLWSLAGIVLLAGFVLRLGGPGPALAAAALAAVNPLDVFFAQEARMYAQAAAMATASTWVLWEWLRANGGVRRAWLWIAYTALAAAMVFTHYATAAVLVAQGLWATGVLLRRGAWRRLAAYYLAAVVSAVALAPWFVFVGMTSGKLNTGGIAWMPPSPPAHYVNYLWRDFLWGHVAAMQDRWWALGVVLMLLALGAAAFVAATRLREGAPDAARRADLAYCAWLAFSPPLVAAALSAAVVNMYNRERFALYVLAPFLALVSLALMSAAIRRAGRAILVILFAVMAAGTLVQSRAPLRTDWRSFARLWTEAGPPARVVFLPYYEALPASRVLGVRVPGSRADELESDVESLKGREIWTVMTDPDLRNAPPEVRGFAAWLSGLGGRRTLLARPGLAVQAVTVGEFPMPEEFRGRFREWYEPDDIQGRIEGFLDPARFHALESNAKGTAFRWSLPSAWLLLKHVDGATTATIRFTTPPGGGGVRFTAVRTADTTKENATSASCAAAPDGAELDIALPPGTGPVALGWETQAVNPKGAGAASDNRELGIGLEWIGIAAP